MVKSTPLVSLFQLWFRLRNTNAGSFYNDPMQPMIDCSTVVSNFGDDCGGVGRIRDYLQSNPICMKPAQAIERKQKEFS